MWTISDIGNALMAIPNIIVILLLSGMIARETRHYVYDGNLDEEYGEPVPRVKGLAALRNVRSLFLFLSRKTESAQDAA
mgnify:CR=1 FL=1